MLEEKHCGNTHTNPNQTLLAFKPRQVLLAEQKAKAMTTMMKPCKSKTLTLNPDRKTLTLNPDQKAVLLNSVLQYLENNSFSRALKRLLSEAQIENDSWKTCSLNLEDMYDNYLETCTRAGTKCDPYKEQELLTDCITKKDGDSHCSAFEQTVGRKKKKKSDESDSNAAANQSGTDDKFSESTKNSMEILANDLLTDSNVEFKEKKIKRVSDSLHQTEEVDVQSLKKPTADTVCELQTDESTKKQKDKKKKKNKSISKSLDGIVEEMQLDSLPVVNEETCTNLKPPLGGVKIDSEAEVKSKDKKKKDKATTDSLGDSVEHCALGDKKCLIANNLGGNVGQEQSDLLPMATEDKSKDLASSKGSNKTDSEAKGKSKDKKKKKKQSMDSLVENMEQCNSALEDMHNISLEEKKVGSKDKKRKKEGSISETLSGGVPEVPNKDDPIKNESRKESVQTFEDATDKEKKSSKKRKRLACDENEGQLVEKLVSEESKRRKTERLEETKCCEQLTKVNAITGDDEHAGKKKGENGHVVQIELQNTSIEAHANGNLEKDGEKSAAQKIRKKQHNGSAEPKTVNAFQRVKIDEVKFADERLQNNSYWAKDGAEVGYGAKAQEILGQVKGRYVFELRHVFTN
ncbi:hypothetical protein LOK49_LG13G00141 [Camellia lanceoleosa]|uniref:Uncharacterized protein n=1 Tax=Camellia lanceoleosa TaxID=1840588 RepID=A0ACC0FKK6_9ERIC|nr:hypothetical protein LOK49_LG13G00141 [Camellia lanceoleosa]